MKKEEFMYYMRTFSRRLSFMSASKFDDHVKDGVFTLEFSPWAEFPLIRQDRYGNEEKIPSIPKGPPPKVRLTISIEKENVEQGELV